MKVPPPLTIKDISLKRSNKVSLRAIRDGGSYLLFALYTLIFGLFLFTGNNPFKQRLASVFFWLLFIGSNYIVFIPFIKGTNPF